MRTIKSFYPQMKNEKFWGYGLFWSWNLIFLAFMILGFAPNVLPQMVDAIRRDLIPSHFLVPGILVTLTPVGAVALGLTILRRSPKKLLALGYGVEGPLMVLLLARIFLVRQATPAITMLYGISLLGILTLLWQLLDPKVNERGRILDGIRLGGLTWLLLVGVYAAVIIAFYAIPITLELPTLIADAARQFWYTITHLTWETLLLIPFSFFGILLLIYTATLFIAAPVAVPLLYIDNWRLGMKRFGMRYGPILPYGLTIAVSLITLVVFSLMNQQPQHKAYALLTNPPQSAEDAWDLILQEDTIRDGLLNAYLAPVRYISAVGEVGHIHDLYQWSFKLSDDAAFAIENAFEVAARPMLYEPMEPSKDNRNQTDWWNQRSLRTEPQKASQLYEAFFDTPITKGERDTIVKAVRNTWSGDQALLAWQAVDDREILLTQQEIHITEHGDWAEVELFEVYQNQTSTRQEVVYYFNLPETAVLTGLWLGNSPDREERFNFHISPRGAAQQMYREQLRVNIDPALLEQVGPRQYRLRVFPIEPQVWRWSEKTRRSSVEPGPPLYMWMTYLVLANEGSWSLPQLAEKANVYWDTSTVRKINGTSLEGTNEAWLPASVAVSSPIPAAVHQVIFPSGETIYLSPAGDQPQPSLPSAFRLAVVLDRSQSMVSLKDEVTAALAKIATIDLDVDVYLTASEYRGENPSVAKLANLVPNNILYYGGQNAADLLQQFFALSAGRSYDALFVFTDGTGFKLGGQDIQLAVPDMPVWMVHLGGEFPLGYDDATLQVIQASGGGVAGNLEDAINRLAISMEGKYIQNGILRDIVDGYEWLTIPAGNTPPLNESMVVHSSSDPFAALAARRLILSEMQRQRGQITDLETLDNFHEIAKEQGIVTPYSSMIVLVTRAQERRLEELENKDSRFEREAEEVGETTPSPFEVTGVPEPHEWLLIGLGIALLIWFGWQRRLQ